MGKNRLFKNPIAFLCLVITICSFSVLILSLLRLPETLPVNHGRLSHNQTPRISDFQKLGFFGEIMIDMLPQDLAFTAFVSSDAAFSRDLGLKVNDSWVNEKRADVDDNTYAIVSRVLGFSVIPRTVTEHDLAVGETLSYDSLSGFTLYISKDLDNGLVVNGVKAEKMGLRIGKIVVHVMDAVIMDSEFAQLIDLSENADEQDER